MNYQTTILLDAGHGGIQNGLYQTKGKRYYGTHQYQEVRIAEGAYNKAVAFGIQAKLHTFGVKTHIINPEPADISLQARARRVNQFARAQKCVLFSIHHNAYQAASVRGAEFFTSVGDTSADPIAEYIAKKFADCFPNEKLRTNTIDPTKYSKEAGYFILKSTVCPAVLTEWAFMTNEHDRRRIFDLGTQIDFFTDAILEMFDTRLIR